MPGYLFQDFPSSTCDLVMEFLRLCQSRCNLPVLISNNGTDKSFFFPEIISESISLCWIHLTIVVWPHKRNPLNKVRGYTFFFFFGGSSLVTHLIIPDTIFFVSKRPELFDENCGWYVIWLGFLSCVNRCHVNLFPHVLSFCLDFFFLNLHSWLLPSQVHIHCLASNWIIVGAPFFTLIGTRNFCCVWIKSFRMESSWMRLNWTGPLFLYFFDYQRRKFKKEEEYVYSFFFFQLKSKKAKKLMQSTKSL